nr:hypothetical protein [Streptomyces sp. 846.5]
MEPYAEDAARSGGTRRHALDLEPFWPSRQPFHFDETCRRSTGAQVRIEIQGCCPGL